MIKKGLRLIEIEGFPEELHKPLLNMLSITTAEELVAMNACMGAMLHRFFSKEEELLKTGIELAKKSIPEELLIKLEEPIKERYSTGALFHAKSK